MTARRPQPPPDESPPPPRSEERESSMPQGDNEAPRRLPEGVLRAMRNARPGRPDTEEEKELYAERRIEEDVPAEAVTSEIADQWHRPT